MVAYHRYHHSRAAPPKQRPARGGEHRSTPRPGRTMNTYVQRHASCLVSFIHPLQPNSSITTLLCSCRRLADSRLAGESQDGCDHIWHSHFFVIQVTGNPVFLGGQTASLFTRHRLPKRPSSASFGNESWHDTYCRHFLMASAYWLINWSPVVLPNVPWK